MSDRQPEEGLIVDGAIIPGRLWADMVRADKITAGSIAMSGDTLQPGDRVHFREIYGEGYGPRDAAVEKAAERVMAALRGAGLEPDMSTLKVTDYYDEAFLQDMVAVEVIAK